MNRIASVDFERPLSDLADELGRSFAEFGFAIVRNHSIEQSLIRQAEVLQHALFALPTESKMRYHVPGSGGVRGYTPFGVETAKDAKVHDLKEFWHVGRPLPAGETPTVENPANIWPAELPALRETAEDLFRAFEQTGARLLAAIALHLGLAEDYFDATIAGGTSLMRLLHYPPLPADVPPGAVRAAAHGDINTITLLLGAEEAGLQLLTREGEWLAVDPPPGALAVNMGDMLERLTNGRLRSTLHRVVNPTGPAARRSRYSMPFFLHFRPDYLIDPLPSCIAPGDSPPAPITAGEFLQQRLREIRLK